MKMRVTFVFEKTIGVLRIDLLVKRYKFIIFRRRLPMFSMRHAVNDHDEKLPRQLRQLKTYIYIYRRLCVREYECQILAIF